MIWVIQTYYYPEDNSTSDIRFVYVEIETCLAITAACGPALKPLVVNWFPRFISVSGDTYNHNPSDCNVRVTGKTSTNVKATVNRLRHPCGVPGTSSFALRDLRERQQEDKELRDQSPTGSEEAIMTYHGIMRTREYTVEYGNVDEDRRASKSPFTRIKPDENSGELGIQVEDSMARNQ